MTVDLARIAMFRRERKHEEAKHLLLEWLRDAPNDATLNYEVACTHDFLGLEREAIPFYQTAIKQGLADYDLRGAYLGLGSTYRTLGMYDESKKTLLEGLQKFPEANELKVFLAMTLFNLKQHHDAVTSLLYVLLETTNDTEIKNYERAIQMYAEDLNRRW
ncbi:MAG: tetratricopeptide repeat protein [Trueperaceae bacterium]